MKLLIVMCRLMYPPDTGGKIRSSNLFERLKKEHEITMVSLRYPHETDAQVQEMFRACHRLETVNWKESEKFSPTFFAEIARNTISPRPYIVNKYHSPQLEAKVRELLAQETYDILLCDFLQASANVLDVAHPAKILFQHNVEAVIRKRQYQKRRNPVTAAVLYNEWRKLFRYEREACSAFHHNIMVSEKDCETMATDYGVRNTSSIPTGVDTEFFRSREPESDGADIVFTGSMDWLPNEDGVSWFVTDIMPRIRNRVKNAKFWIVGRNPSPLVRALAEHPDVEVTGTVDDVRPFIDRAKAYVVPLRIGGGTRIKIFEAMAMSKAIVSTTIGAEGLPVTDGEDIAIADQADLFADRVVRLLSSEGERRTLGTTACKLVNERYTQEVVAKRFAEICGQVVASTSSAGRLRNQAKPSKLTTA